MLRKISKNGCISEQMFKELYSVDARPGIMCDKPKTHKQNILLRPIISSFGKFSHKTAKYLSKLLSPLAVNNYLLQDSYDFVNRSHNLNFRMAHMLSFDVESLFTNIPLDFTINLILERVYKNKEIEIMIPEHELKKLLNL